MLSASTIAIPASVLLGSALIAGALSWASPAAQPRFQLMQAGQALAWRLDTRSGDLVACRIAGGQPLGTAGASCWPVASAGRERWQDDPIVSAPAGSDGWVPVQPQAAK